MFTYHNDVKQYGKKFPHKSPERRLQNIIKDKKMHKQNVFQSSRFVAVGTSVALSVVLLAATLFFINTPAYAETSDTPEGFDTWQPLNGPLGPGGKVEALALGTGTLSDTLYAIVGVPYNGGMSRAYRSTDSAATWTQVYLTFRTLE